MSNDLSNGSWLCCAGACSFSISAGLLTLTAGALTIPFLVVSALAAIIFPVMGASIHTVSFFTALPLLLGSPLLLITVGAATVTIFTAFLGLAACGCGVVTLL